MAKYGPGGSVKQKGKRTGKKKKMESEPSEEEFQALQAKMFKRK